MDATFARAWQRPISGTFDVMILSDPAGLVLNANQLLAILDVPTRRNRRPQRFAQLFPGSDKRGGKGTQMLGAAHALIGQGKWLWITSMSQSEQVLPHDPGG